VTIVLNGQQREAPEGGSILALLETIGSAPERVAVEVNGCVVPRASFARTALCPGDRVEVVQFVGGG
jgi:sulfur carrier protein